MDVKDKVIQTTPDNGDRAETQTAYEVFLNNLPVRNPDKILFIAIPLVPGDLFLADTATKNGYQAYPPLGYLYLSAAAKLANPDLELSILDLNFELLRRHHLGILDKSQNFWQELVSREIGDGTQLHVCVGNSWGVMTPQFLEVTKYIRETFPQVSLITGGAQTTINYRQLVEGDYCHIAFRHQSEMEFKAFLDGCRNSKSAIVPQGAAFKSEGKFYETDPISGPPEMLDIRESYNLINLDDYHSFGGMNPYSKYVGKEKTYATILGNRGCRANCTFCGVKAFYPAPVLTRSARSVVDEIKFLVDQKGVKLVEFLDDDLIFSQKGSLELFQLMAEELPSDFEWISQNGITASAISEELMNWMVKSGCVGFKVGVETGNTDRLRKIRKPATKERFLKAGEMFKKYPQVHVSGNIMLGFPNETFGELMESYAFANELAWDWANFIIVAPVADTPMFEEFKALGDERCVADQFGGNIPARSAPQSGNFGYQKEYQPNGTGSSQQASGRDIFNLPQDHVPSSDQLREIWFTFNIETNFFNNSDWKPGGDVEKAIRWFESIHGSYPRDASMSAMLAHGYRLMGNQEKSDYYRNRFRLLVDEYDYWKRRVAEFPELKEYAG